MNKIFITFLFLVNLFSIKNALSQTYPIYIGTYTSASKSDGVYVYDFNEGTGQTSFIKNIKMSNPSFLAKRGDVLYAVNEDAEGKVTAYDLKKDKAISMLSTEGAHPCHVSLSPKDPLLVVSNYSGGSLIVYSLKENGEINKKEVFIQFKGSSINKDRQNASHIHSAFFNKDGSKLYVSDLGTDIIHEYEVVQKEDGYDLNELNQIMTTKGGGPRHIALSSNGKDMYIVLELTGELATYRLINHKWNHRQNLPIYESNFKGEQGAADIKISPDGKFVYATNRGTANVYAKYKVQKNGKLKLERINSVQGNSPRNINLSKNGKWIFVSNQLTDHVTVLSANQKKSYLIHIPKPVCVIF